MSSDRILIIGDGNHQFIINLVKQLRKQASERLTINVLSLSRVYQQNIHYYDEVYSPNFGSRLYGFISKIMIIRRFYRQFLLKRYIKTIPKHSSYGFHFLSTDSCYVLKILKRSQHIGRFVISIWGSDLYRLKRYNTKRFLAACKAADRITFTNRSSLRYFTEKYGWNRNNLRVCRFGLVPLSKLKDNNYTKQECKALLGWNSSKLAIVVGYNASEGQQHLQILEQLQNSSFKSYVNSVILILPLTYGGNPEYRSRIVQMLTSMQYEFKIYDSFVSDDTIAHIRKASDILVQLQITDQFSGSMQEHLYCNNIVITGSWLPYESLKEAGVRFIEIDGLKELGSSLIHVLDGFPDLSSEMMCNSSIIYELSSWENNILSWYDLYVEKCH